VFGLALVEWSVLAVASLALALGAVGAIRLAVRRAVRRAIRRIERAYVSISCVPPGLVIDEPPKDGPEASEPQELRIAIEVTNRGGAPANITAYLLTHHIGQGLPEDPPYAKARPSSAKAFLPADHSFRFNCVLALGAKDMAVVRTGQARLWILGYVDYRDNFQKRYRSGYARRWNPRSAESGNNLVIEAKPRYNYDRERDRGEGNDWGA
jgi:hypothetical protein